MTAGGRRCSAHQVYQGVASDTTPPPGLIVLELDFYAARPKHALAVMRLVHSDEAAVVHVNFVEESLQPRNAPQAPG